MSSHHHPATVRRAGRKRGARFESSKALGLAEQPAVVRTVPWSCNPNQIVHQLGEPFLGGALRLGSRVVAVERPLAGGVLVRVQHANGATKTYGGRFAVITFSTGVLQKAIEVERARAFQESREKPTTSASPVQNSSSHDYTGYSYDEEARPVLSPALIFGPPLPKWKEEAIDLLPMGHFL